MANKRIDQLTAATSAANTDLLFLGDPTTGALKKITVSLVSPQNTEVTLTDSTTVTWDFSAGNVGKVTLGGNRTLAITNVPVRSFGILKITQDGVGNRLLTLPAGSLIPTGFALTTTASLTDVLGFYYDGTNYYWSIDKGYAAPITTTTTTSTTSTTTTSTTTIAPSFLTWSTIDSDLEQYNTNKGIRKKASAADGWVPNSVAWANETLSSGQKVIAKIGTNPALGIALGLNAAKTGDGGSNVWAYSFTAAYALTNVARAKEGATFVADQTVAASSFIRISYNVGSIVFEYSTNGTSWSTVGTAPTPPSGTYFIGIGPYSTLAGFDEIYKA